MALWTGWLVPEGIARAQRGVSNAATGSTVRRTRPSPRMPVRLVKRDELTGGVAEAESAAAKRPNAGQDESRYGQPLKLPEPRKAKTEESGGPGSSDSTDGGSVTWVVLSSLAIVLGLFFLVVWLARRALPRAGVSLPNEVLEVVGRSPLAARHNLQLIRLGGRLLLVSVTPETAETLTEVTDADEVNHLISLCRQHQPESITGSFRQALHQLGTQPEVEANRANGTADRLEFGANAASASSASFPRARQRS